MRNHLPSHLARTKRAFWFSTVVILGSVAVWSMPVLAAAVWSDPLTGSQVDPTRWTISTSSADMTVAPSSEGVLMSTAGSAHGASFVAAISSLCSVEGDFDVQVDYQLGLWPAKSGVRMGLTAGSKSGFGATIERDSLSATDVPVQKPGSEVYLTDFEPMSGGTFMDVPTADVQGTLRLVRSGGSVTAYFASAGASWTIVASVAAPSEPVTLNLQAWSADGIFDKKSGGASVYFRNLVVNSGRLNCPVVVTGGLDGGSGNVVDAGNVAETGNITETGNTAETGNTVDAAFVVDAGDIPDLDDSSDASNSPDANDAPSTRIVGHSSSGCGCFVAGRPSSMQPFFLGFLGVCVAALGRRRRS
jgi:hypothetical protein